MAVVPVVVLVLAVAVLATIQTLHSRSVGRQRRAVLRDVEPLFTDVVVTQDGIGFPCLRGTWRGRTVKVDLSVDAVAMRQLPVLWMLVTVLRPLPVRTPIDITLRPRSSDIVSAGTRFGYEHQAPEGWPEDLRVTTPAPALPPLEVLDEFVDLLDQPTTKGLLIAPRGVRIVHELARGAVGQYRVVRRPKFDATVDPARLTVLLELADRVADRVEAAGAPVGAPAG